VVVVVWAVIGSSATVGVRGDLLLRLSGRHRDCVSRTAPVVVVDRPYRRLLLDLARGRGFGRHPAAETAGFRADLGRIAERAGRPVADPPGPRPGVARDRTGPDCGCDRSDVRLNHPITGEDTMTETLDAPETSGRWSFESGSAPRVHVIHENPEWFPPFEEALRAADVPFQEVLLVDGSLDLDAEPAPGVYWSRLSASAHTRGHGQTKEFTRAVAAWLEGWGRRVVGGTHVIELEVSKVAQHALLRRNGFDVPRTLAVFGRDDLAVRARELDVPFITKHNQGGKGLGVRRFDSHADFDAYLASPEFEEPADGITLLQEFLISAEPFVTRAEFVGGRFVYAVRVDTSAGSFELCPADACEVPTSGPPFALREEITADHPLVQRYEALLAGAGIEIAGIEFLETADGRTVTYDINTNTNYNPAVEAVSPASGPGRIAHYLGDLLRADGR
jgi:glutathione synthase/RimK-type ligase-like ATP-grasp enzyme